MSRQLNSTEQSIANLFTDSDIILIDTWLKKTLLVRGRIQRPEAYAALKNQTNEKLDEAKWSTALSLNLASGRLSGYNTVRGRYGGIELADPVKVAKTVDIASTVNTAFEQTIIKPVKKEEPKSGPAIKTMTHTLFKYPRHVWIGRKLFKVSTSTSNIRKLFVEVLRCSQSDEGNVTFDGVKWSCKDEALLERFLGGFMYAVSTGESDPVLNDDSGVPVELRI